MDQKRLLTVILATGIALNLFLILGRTTVNSQTPVAPTHTLIANTIIPELVGQTSEAVGRVALQGNYAYIGLDSHLAIVDILDPFHPFVVGQTDELSGLVRGVAVAGNYAYITNRYGSNRGLHIINISNPAAPTEVGFYDIPSGAMAVMVVGNYAYVTAGISGLRIINISNPAVPTEIGFYDTSDYAFDVAVVGNYAYVADTHDGLRIINISNPTAPTEIGFYDTPPSFVAGVAVAGNYAYVTHNYPAGGSNPGLGIIDISNPAIPAQAGYYDILPFRDFATGVVVAGNYAYIANGEDGLRIINISNPAAPIEAGFYDTPDNVFDVAVAGNYAYVADADGGLHILRLLTDKIMGEIPVTGGSFSSTNGDTNLIFSDNAFTQTVNITYRQLLYDENVGALAGLGRTFEVTAVYSDTEQPAILAPGQIFTVTLHYTDTEKGAAIENTLGLYYWDATTWTKETISTVDVINNTITATLSHLSFWAVLGETNRVYFPQVFK